MGDSPVGEDLGIPTSDRWETRTPGGSNTVRFPGPPFHAGPRPPSRGCGGRHKRLALHRGPVGNCSADLTMAVLRRGERAIAHTARWFLFRADTAAPEETHRDRPTGPSRPRSRPSRDFPGELRSRVPPGLERGKVEGIPRAASRGTSSVPPRRVAPLWRPFGRFPGSGCPFPTSRSSTEGRVPGGSLAVGGVRFAEAIESSRGYCRTIRTGAP